MSREESLAQKFEEAELVTPKRSHPSPHNKPYLGNDAVLLVVPMELP